MTARASIVAAACLLLAGAVDAAPRSRPATGPLGDQIAAAIAGGSASFDHGAWNRLLAAAVDDSGRVDYPFFQDHRAELDRYLDAIAAVKLGTLERDQAMALLINAYNALTVASILDHPTVDSIRDIDGVWDERRHRVGGFDLTLDDIEHTLLRPFFRDPRVHFAVNCASSSCAPLPRWAFTGEKLEEQLEERTRSFLSDSRNVRIEGGTLSLSSYFDWYGDDFVDEAWRPRASSAREFVAGYASPEVAARLRSGEALKQRYLDYDWSLNASRAPRHP
jgi:hypothetical protein